MVPSISIVRCQLDWVATDRIRYGTNNAHANTRQELWKIDGIFKVHFKHKHNDSTLSSASLPKPNGSLRKQSVQGNWTGKRQSNETDREQTTW